MHPTSVTHVSSLEDSEIAKNNILTINGELSLQAIEDLKMISEKQKELKK